MRGRAFVLAAALALIVVLPMQAASPKANGNDASVHSWIVTLQPGHNGAAEAPGLAKQGRRKSRAVRTATR